MDALDSAGELRRVSEPVDCHLEAGTIADKLVKSKGPAILFEQPRLAVSYTHLTLPTIYSV